MGLRMRNGPSPRQDGYARDKGNCSYRREKKRDSDISKPVARISSDLKQGSFFPFSRSEMNARPSPVCTARYVCVQPRFSRRSRIRLPKRTQTSVATDTAWLYSLDYRSP